MINFTFEVFVFVFNTVIAVFTHFYTLHYFTSSAYFWTTFFMYLFVGRGGKKGAVETCPTCNGNGIHVQIQQLGPSMVQHIQSVCQECRGQGERINPKDRCKTCQGRKVHL